MRYSSVLFTSGPPAIRLADDLALGLGPQLLAGLLQSRKHIHQSSSEGHETKNKKHIPRGSRYASIKYDGGYVYDTWNLDPFGVGD